MEKILFHSTVHQSHVAYIEPYIYKMLLLALNCCIHADKTTAESFVRD